MSFEHVSGCVLSERDQRSDSDVPVPFVFPFSFFLSWYLHLWDAKVISLLIDAGVFVCVDLWLLS